MLNSLRLQNFKRFRDLQLSNFQRVNLLTGKNNCGKTSVLEAILLLLDLANSGQSFLKVFRPGSRTGQGDEDETFWKWVFPRRDLKEALSISGELTDDREYSVNLHWQPGGRPLQMRPGVTSFPLSDHVKAVAAGVWTNTQSMAPPILMDRGVTTIPANPRDPSQEAQDYARAALRSGAEDQVEEMLRKIEPCLKSIRSLQPYGVPLLYVGIEGLPERIPAIQLGHGFSRLLSIMAEIVESEKPVILIDEIENGLHHSALIDIWRGLLTACEHSDVQIFATTHSWECVAAAHQAFSESLDYPLAVFRLEAGKDDVSVVAYDRDSLQYSVEHDWEVR